MNPGCRVQDQLNTSESTAPYIIFLVLPSETGPVFPVLPSDVIANMRLSSWITEPLHDFGLIIK